MFQHKRSGGVIVSLAAILMLVSAVFVVTLPAQATGGFMAQISVTKPPASQTVTYTVGPASYQGSPSAFSLYIETSGGQSPVDGLWTGGQIAHGTFEVPKGTKSVTLTITYEGNREPRPANIVRVVGLQWPTEPTATPRPTEPTVEPTVEPTGSPKPSASATSDPEPTEPTATPEPTEPTVEPTVKPTGSPKPSAAATSYPKPTEPTVKPTVKPTGSPKPSASATSDPEPAQSASDDGSPRPVPGNAPKTGDSGIGDAVLAILALMAAGGVIVRRMAS